MNAAKKGFVSSKLATQTWMHEHNELDEGIEIVILSWEL